MVWSGSCFVNVEQFAHLPDEGRLKLLPLVRVQLFWRRESAKELVNQFLRYCGGLLVWDASIQCVK